MTISPTDALRAVVAGAGTPGTRPQQEHQGQAEGAGTAEAVLCRHCGRTATNRIPCQGMCVADSDY